MLQQVCEMESGSGPRHVIVHPTLPLLYVLNELHSTICTLALDRDGPSVSRLCTTPTTDDPGDPGNRPSDLAIHPSAQVLYAVNRGHDTVRAWSIDGSTGALTLLNCAPAGGKRARGIAVTPSGDRLYVANTNSDTVSTIALDPNTGALGQLTALTSVPHPTCIRFWSRRQDRPTPERGNQSLAP